ncbi:hypothetical protein AB0D04_42465 [Streptomyces sp. NPDC048483]|uniref:hypothetical protein n=1 Tax=Streptomyces sp. NPDC048483 TaxID=3154927 RepID=UPI0034372BE0
MRRATLMLRSVAVAVVATAVGCLLVLTLLPSHARPWPTAAKAAGAPGAAPGHAAMLGQDGSAAPAAATGPGAATTGQPKQAQSKQGRSGHGKPHHGKPRHRHPKHGKPGHGKPKRAPRAARISVMALQPGLSFRGNGSFSVTWTNGTGRDVDVWLTHSTAKQTQRLALVAPRAGARPAGEALVTLPQLAPGRAYALEVATGDGTAHAFSTRFSVTG